MQNTEQMIPLNSRFLTQQMALAVRTKWKASLAVMGWKQLSFGPLGDISLVLAGDSMFLVTITVFVRI